MKVFGFEDVSLESILDYMEANDSSEKTKAGISSAHLDDFKFSDKYVLKGLGSFEFAVMSQMCQPSNETQKRFASHLPKIYGLIYCPNSDKGYIAMENFASSPTCSQIEIKVGYYNYLPTHWEQKQQSKIRSAFIMDSIDLGYRVCMLHRKDMKGNDIDKRKIFKVEGVKRPLRPNSLQLMINLQPEEASANKKAFLLKAIDFYESQLRDLLDIFANHIEELGYLLTAASLMFIIDFKQETFGLKFFDFGCSFPASRMDLWKDEQADSLRRILEDLTAVRQQVADDKSYQCGLSADHQGNLLTL